MALYFGCKMVGRAFTTQSAARRVASTVARAEPNKHPSRRFVSHYVACLHACGQGDSAGISGDSSKMWAPSRGQCSCKHDNSAARISL